MPRKKQVPRYTLHKTTGQARVIINGKHHYLGLHGSAESKERYASLIAEQFLNPRAEPVTPPGSFPDLSINEVILKYIQHAEQYYVKDGQPTKEVDNIDNAMRSLRTLFSHTRASEFGPKALKAVQRYMIEHEDICRKQINARVNRIRRMFKWLASEELVPASVHAALTMVDGLREGRTAARETAPVEAVPDEHVELTLAFLSPIVSDMVQIQRLTSARSGEIVIMRQCDIDKTDDVWVYTPYTHKTKHRKKKRNIPLGPKAQSILQKYFNRPADVFLFSPRENLAWVNEQRKLKSPRTSKIFPCEVKRLKREREARKRRKNHRVVGDRYTTESYYRAVQYGLVKAAAAGVIIPHWFNHQLRHAGGTAVRRDHGVEAAQVVLGHAKIDATELYAETNLKLAKELAQKAG